MQNNDINENDEKIEVQFGGDESSDIEHTEHIDNNNNNEQCSHNGQCSHNKHNEQVEVKQNSKHVEDLSRYTVVDHLDEDEPIRGQEFCLFSFLSPEGVMNCNVRAVKFRGAYPTMEAAEKAAEELGKTDKYFKIFIGESGKWLDFDPPVSRVDREMSSNKEHQKILDAQRKQRMEKINALAGKHKENADKTDNGKKERIDESKKAGAASDAIDRQKVKRQEKQQEKQEKQQEKRAATQANSRETSLNKTKERMQKRIAESRNKKALDRIDTLEKQQYLKQNQESQNLDEKIKVVGKASSDLESKKAKLEAADKNIDNIKQLLAKKRAQKEASIGM